MKKLFIVAFLIAGVSLGATLLASKVKPAKQELPEVIVNGTLTGVRGYTAPFKVELACPRENTNQSTFISGSAEGTVVYVKHCLRCNIGVYSEHQDEQELHEGNPVKRCTFCSDKEPL